MSNRIKEVRISHVDLLLKKPFKHALALRSQSDSIFVKLSLEDGTVGYGESLPREYVTGETSRSVIDDIKNIAQHRLLLYAPGNYESLSSFIESLPLRGAARCVLDLALLDTYGRHFNTPVSSIIRGIANDSFSYSGVIQAGSLWETAKSALMFKIFGFSFVKVKVGVGDDIARLKVARGILGQGVDMRVDANCAWSADEAIERIKELYKFNISAVEQPVGADDYGGLKKVTEAVSTVIIADESLRTLEDARRLAGLKACGMFNIRISKCGGLLSALKIAEFALQNNIGIQLGCQVGESGLLSAAGWHFASAHDISFCEGSYGRHLLKEDITEEDMTIQPGGVIRPVSGPGLGINVSERILNKYVVAQEVVKQ